ncbi:39S ribosomal protein L51, mitochondrial [Cladophialophora chaetospira]|uniref:Large ribosomal subunit protein mL43 n=1 Tax=Cladophialophora chaetospira TaxID=386627 RepID=A0AA38XIC2_9EURO|nr:39S ribosomal protein L51, mitochondrial [Cladophialophora chaetospira]
MGVQGVKTVSTARNGVGAYILQCTRLHLTYSDHWVSSTGLLSLLRSPSFPRLTHTYPSVEFRISPIPNRHPVLKATYVNGRSKAICVKNLSKEQVAEKLEFLLGNSGTKNVRVGGRKVISENESVRGVWSPMHGGIKTI